MAAHLTVSLHDGDGSGQARLKTGQAEHLARHHQCQRVKGGLGSFWVQRCVGDELADGFPAAC